MSRVGNCFVSTLGMLAVAVLVGTYAPAAAGASSTQSEGSSNRYDRPTALSRAILAFKREDMAMAVRHAEDALGSRLANSELRFALHILCVEQTQLGAPEAALDYCDRAVAEFDADRPAHLNNRANAHLKLGHVAAAIADYETALSISRDGPSAAVVEKNLELARSIQDSQGAPIRPNAARESETQPAAAIR